MGFRMVMNGVTIMLEEGMIWVEKTNGRGFLSSNLRVWTK